MPLEGRANIDFVDEVNWYKKIKIISRVPMQTLVYLRELIV